MEKTNLNLSLETFFIKKARLRPYVYAGPLPAHLGLET